MVENRADDGNFTSSSSSAQREGDGGRALRDGARYSALAAWAKEAGQKDVAQLLEETFGEEKKADTLLNTLATRHINRAAKQHAA